MSPCSAGQFLDFIGHFLPQENYLDLPRITGRDLQEVARAKKSTAGGLDGWAWNEIKALSVALVFWSCYSFGSWLRLLVPGRRGFSMPFLP